MNPCDIIMVPRYPPLPEQDYPLSAIRGHPWAKAPAAYQQRVRQGAAAAVDLIWGLPAAVRLDGAAFRRAFETMHGNYMGTPFVPPLRRRAIPAVIAQAEYVAVKAVMAAAGGGTASAFYRPEAPPGDLVRVPSVRVLSGEEWCRLRRVLPDLPDAWQPRDTFMPPDWSFTGHYFLDPEPHALTAAFDHAASLLNRMRDLSGVAGARQEFEQILGEFTYLTANFHPFPNGNWGTFFILIHQARARAGLDARPSTGLDFLMMYVDRDQAPARYLHWSQGRFDEWLLSPLGAPLLRYPDPALCPEWLLREPQRGTD